ncbi:polysaccharide deacetylase family protein [Bradyrhizobium lablabi]|uniref:polysaccharide deacetylase family protein n=1 Tax=Bradyrhizobium lablabi TaxID=722472 RepID=UPI001BA98E8D|nr:polysaccharide deacetylase family protein [Bradyrhizobium lablabi]MBR1125047.1 polysaccharide deacetylase family protein [Bradyrhizobium lablabi]
MSGNVGPGVGLGVRTQRWAGWLALLIAGMASGSALAANCPGHPDALGTSRTLVVDAKAHPLIGTMQYRETLPLEDGEVVLTFDDGPLPKYSNQILEILAAQCVKATFFLVGQQARANPEGVRKVRDAGHTVATHTQNHPSGMHKLPLERATKDIEDGIASVKAALGDGGAALSPFFRIPGLARNDGIEEFTRAQGLQIWSADFPADDWRPVSSRRVHDLAMQRLKGKGKGILLLHDIQPRTVAALPGILRDLKAGGYRIVHVVPATADLPATPTEPIQWLLNPPSEHVPVARWPRIPNFVFAETRSLPVPQLTDTWWNDGAVLDHPKRAQRGVPLPREAPWPRLVQVASAGATLPVPAAGVFEVEEGLRVAMRGVASSARRAEPTRAAQAEPKRPARLAHIAARHGKRIAGASAIHGKPAVSGKPAHHARAAGPAGRKASKRAIPDKKNAKGNGRNREARA